MRTKISLRLISNFHKAMVLLLVPPARLRLQDLEILGIGPVVIDSVRNSATYGNLE